MTPRRIQRKRSAGWKMPANTVYVGRPGKWGNPFKVSPGVDVAGAVQLYRAYMETLVMQRHNEALRKELRAALRGKNLACWCPLDRPCHADVLLEIANR